MDMKKATLAALILTFAALLYGQHLLEDLLPREQCTTGTDLERELLVYPDPIIDQFRIDLREFKGKATVLEIVRTADQQLVYSKKMMNLSGNSIQLSAYAIGLKKEPYLVRLVCDDHTLQKTIQPE